MHCFWTPVIKPFLDIIKPKAIIEIGSGSGINTRNLLDYCMQSGATLYAIDPAPQFNVAEWKEQYGENFVFQKALSLKALDNIPRFDLVLIDGDHNWYTVINELKLIEKRCRQLSQPFPPVMLHDIGWPYGRRDLYYYPDSIPETFRKPYKQRGMQPGQEKLMQEGGLNKHLFNAICESSIKSGVLTAVEDFLKDADSKMDFVKLSGFHGFGIIVPVQLKNKNAEISEFLHDLEMTPTIARYVDMIEASRLETAITLNDEIENIKKINAELNKRLKRLEDGVCKFDAGQEHEEKEIKGFRKELFAAKQIIKENEKQFLHLQTKLQKEDGYINELIFWLTKLEEVVAELSKSKRWKTGNLLGEIKQKILLRSSAPTAIDSINTIFRNFHKWEKKYKESVDARLIQDKIFGLPKLAIRWDCQKIENILSLKKTFRNITIIIPIFNSYSEVNQCLDSVRQNTANYHRVLLINDCSTDPNIHRLLDHFSQYENVEVLHNQYNIGYSRSINRGLQYCEGDVILLNSDTIVGPNWVQKLFLNSYFDDNIATVTAISNAAGAFSVPNVGNNNAMPAELVNDHVCRLISKTSLKISPECPVGNGFCMYVKRKVLEQIGLFDEDDFPYGYGVENEFCLRALKAGWRHVVDDSNFIFHHNASTFGAEKQNLLKSADERLRSLFPGYPSLVGEFIKSAKMRAIRKAVRSAYNNVQAGIVDGRPRILYVLHDASGGTPATTYDLVSGIQHDYECFILTSNARELSLYWYSRGSQSKHLLNTWKLSYPWRITDFQKDEFRHIYFNILADLDIEIVHIRHLLCHAFDLPGLCETLGIPVILSFHDFYFVCPTIHLLDGQNVYCGGVCTSTEGQCRIPTRRLNGLPVLKNNWLITWRTKVQEALDLCDAFVTTSRSSYEVIIKTYPGLENKDFRIIEHGRDLCQESGIAAFPYKGEKVRVLIPGNLGFQKGEAFVRSLKEYDKNNGDILEFHFLGKVPEYFHSYGINWGEYRRDEFARKAAEIRPHFIGIFSVWPETYCHVLTEAWAAGVPVLVSDLGALKERLDKHGGGWAVSVEGPQSAYKKILEIIDNPVEYSHHLEKASIRGLRTLKDMSEDYLTLYGDVRERRRKQMRVYPKQ